MFRLLSILLFISASLFSQDIEVAERYGQTSASESLVPQADLQELEHGLVELPMEVWQSSAVAELGGWLWSGQSSPVNYLGGLGAWSGVQSHIVELGSGGFWGDQAGQIRELGGTMSGRAAKAGLSIWVA